MSSDIFDDASDTEELHRTIAIKAARSKAKNTLFTGRCRYCNAPVDEGIFCNIYCHTDYESEQIIRSRQYR
jgi:hypothetical protein